MRVIILSWEFPPRIVGKLAYYTKKLSLSLAKKNVEPYIITCSEHSTAEYEELENVRIYRAINPVKTHISVLTWVLTLNQEIERLAANIYYQKNKQIALIDAQDWHFIPAAVTLKMALKIPFIYSVDSLEDHRSHSKNFPVNMAIKSIELLGTYEADIIIVKSKRMQSEIVRDYSVQKNKIKVVTPKSKIWIKKVLAVYKKVARG
jgi:glycosyltransferase involved in cell wall biosynthesis